MNNASTVWLVPGIDRRVHAPVRYLSKLSKACAKWQRCPAHDNQQGSIRERHCSCIIPRIPISLNCDGWHAERSKAVGSIRRSESRSTAMLREAPSNRISSEMIPVLFSVAGTPFLEKGKGRGSSFAAREIGVPYLDRAGMERQMDHLFVFVVESSHGVKGGWVL